MAKHCSVIVQYRKTKHKSSSGQSGGEIIETDILSRQRAPRRSELWWLLLYIGISVTAGGYRGCVGGWVDGCVTERVGVIG